MKYLLSSVALVFISSFFWFFSFDSNLPVWKEKYNGVCWVGSRNPLQGGEFQELAANGINAISQTPFGWQSEINNPEIRWQVENDRQWWGESGRGISATLDSSQKFNIHNMLKPHLWARGSWPGEIEMTNEADWKIWFENYENFIVDYARLAEKEGIPMLCIGTELEKTSQREAEWRKIIQAVKKVYSGQLTYAANFTEYQKVNFWDELDFIGIQAYFPLSDKKTPNLKDLKRSWENHIQEIEKLVRKTGKPVLFTEIGYCNTVDAAKEPWVWPNERKEIALSEEIQAMCYQSFFETAYQKDWLAGVYFWKWYPEGKRRDPDFTPQGLKAEKVMQQYFLVD